MDHILHYTLQKQELNINPRAEHKPKGYQICLGINLFLERVGGGRGYSRGCKETCVFDASRLALFPCILSLTLVFGF